MVIIEDKDEDKYYTRVEAPLAEYCFGCVFSSPDSECARPDYLRYVKCSTPKKSWVKSKSAKDRNHYIFKEIDPLAAALEQVRQKELYTKDCK